MIGIHIILVGWSFNFFNAYCGFKLEVCSLDGDVFINLNVRKIFIQW